MSENNATMLQFEFSNIDGAEVISAKGVNPLTMNDGTVRFDIINIETSIGTLRISVNQDTDEIIAEFGDELSSLDGIDILEYLKGKSFSWCWIGRDYRGYLDMLCLSFRGLTPQLAFVGEASAIEVFKIEPIQERFLLTAS